MSSLWKLKDEFPCTSFCGSSSPGGNKNPPIKGDVLSLTVTMYDLKRAISIFNKAKSDGIAISVSLIWPKSSEGYSQLIYTHEIHLIVNSYPENILMVDGIKIRDNTFVGDMQIALFLNQVRYEMERRKNESSKLKLKSIQLI